jgi:hypothetical protein
MLSLILHRSILSPSTTYRHFTTTNICSIYARMIGGFATEIAVPRAISGKTADASHHVPQTRNAGTSAASRARYA